MHNYGEALQYHREVAGLSLMELGRQVGISPQNIGRWERGEVLPNIDFCVRIAAFYGISVNELLGVSEGATKPFAAPMGEKLTASERELLADFRKLSPYLQGIAANTVRGLTGASGDGLHKKA